jgi:hypothetical protein
LDESAIKNGYAEASKNYAANAEGTVARAVALIQTETFKAMAKAINVNV